MRERDRPCMTILHGAYRTIEAARRAYGVSPVAPGFPSMKARRLRRLLERELGYAVVRQKGSHRRMESPDHPAITFALTMTMQSNVRRSRHASTAC